MKLIPVPKGMSPGFYAFMGGVGSKRSPSGEILMVQPGECVPVELVPAVKVKKARKG